MRFVPRPDGSRPSRHDEDSPLFEILGTQTCHTLHSLRKLKPLWESALHAAGLPATKSRRLWDQVLDRERPTWWAEEDLPNGVAMDWTSATHEHFVEFYELTEMMHFLWSALRTNVRAPHAYTHTCSLCGGHPNQLACKPIMSLQLSIDSRVRARDQTLLHYPVETFNKIVTSGQFQRLKPSGVAGPPIVCATHHRHVLEMSVLGYAVCAAVITVCEDDPSPKLLQLTDLTDLAQHAVCNEIGNMKTKPVIDWAIHQPRSQEDPAGDDLRVGPDC